MKKGLKKLLVLVLGVTFIFTLSGAAMAKADNSGKGKHENKEQKQILKEIKKLSKAGMTEEAKEQLSEFIAENPDSWKARKLQWKIQREVAKRQREQLKEELDIVKEIAEEGNIEDALARIEELEENFVASDILLEKKAEILAKLGNLEEAVLNMEEALEFNPWAKGLYKKLGELYENSGEKGLKVFVQGRRPVFDQPPVIKNGRTLVPVRAITEALGATVEYDPTTKEVIITRDDTTVILNLESRTATVNGQEIELDVPATTINARTVVPLRFVSQALDAAVDYDGETEIITIIEEDEEIDEEAADEEAASEEKEEISADETTSEESQEETTAADESQGTETAGSEPEVEIITE